MNVDELVTTARESLTVKRVYGEAIERDGLTVIPAATVAGGLGAGKGTDSEGQQGEGGGFGVSARPAGVYVIRNGQVSWQPAVDVNKVVGAVGLVVVTYLLMRPRVARARAAA
jgi:uncharacterized spore protein YtfJ